MYFSVLFEHIDWYMHHHNGLKITPRFPWKFQN